MAPVWERQLSRLHSGPPGALPAGKGAAGPPAVYSPIDSLTHLAPTLPFVGTLLLGDLQKFPRPASQAAWQTGKSLGQGVVYHCLPAGMGFMCQP